MGARSLPDIALYAGCVEAYQADITPVEKK